MLGKHRIATSLAPLALFALFAIFFFGAAISGDEWPGGPLSFTTLWHSPILRWASERGGATLPLWFSLPATGLPYWAASPGGALFADPFVLAASVFRLSPRASLWLLVALHFIIAGAGVQRWLKGQQLPSAFALLGALIYAASPLFLAFSTNGFVSLATIAASVPWLALHLRPSEAKHQIHCTSVFVIFASWTVLVAGWCGLVTALLAAWSLASLSSDFCSFPRVSAARSMRPFAFLGIILLLFGVGAIAALPRLEFRFHSMEVLPSAPPRLSLSLLGIFWPEATANDRVTLVPYFSFVWAMFLAAGLTRWRQIRFRTMVSIVGHSALICFASATAFWLHDGEPLRQAAILGTGLASAFVGLLLCRAVATDLWQNLRRSAKSDLARQARWLLAIAVLSVIIAAALQLGLLTKQRSLAKPGLSDSPLQQQWASTNSASTGAVAASVLQKSPKLEATRPSRAKPFLRQCLILLFLSALYGAAAHGLPLRVFFLALFGLVLVDLRTSHVLLLHTTHSGTLSALSQAQGVLKELSSDPSSRILLFADAPGAPAELLRSGHPVINVHVPRLPLSYARAATKLSFVVPGAPTRISKEAQWTYLRSAGTRWILATTNTLALLPPTATIVLREDQWVFAQLSPKTMRAQVWQRALRVHDAIQSLALTLNREWSGDEIYVEGKPVAEFPFTQSKGNLGSAEVLWDIGNDIGVEINVPLPSFLALADATYPGWHVWAEGKPHELLRANGWMRAAALPSGRHLVRFVYQPASLRLGAFVTMISLSAAMFWLFGRFFSNQPTCRYCP
ncbi:MAG: hypothetical protein ACP5QZ_00770 [Candidatus Sumerlaeaceae bacterium]